MTQLRMTRRRVLGAGAALAAAPLIAGSFSQPAAAAAPMLGPAQPKNLRFKLGAFEVTMIFDSEAFIDGPWPLIGKNARQEEVDRLMLENLLPANKYRPGFSPMVVNTGKELIVFDTGNGARGFVPRPAGGWLAAQLAPAGIRPEDIDLVVLSHGHPDHIGGVIENGRPLFANARYAIGGTEYDFWSPAGKHTGDLEKYSSLFRDLMVPLAEKTTFLKPGDDVASGIRAVEAFGHTPGHLAFHIDGGGKELFSAISPITRSHRSRAPTGIAYLTSIRRRRQRPARACSKCLQASALPSAAITCRSRRSAMSSDCHRAVIAGSRIPTSLIFEVCRASSGLGVTAGRTAGEAPRLPAGMLGDPFGDLWLGAHHALHGSESLGRIGEAHVLAGGWVVDEADGEQQFDHGWHLVGQGPA